MKEPIKAKNVLHVPVENTNNVSDGYHTFGELYEHRVTLCKSNLAPTLNDQ